MKNVFVFGDLILDKYLFGNIDRISPEAPVPIIDVSRETYKLGGAANVALNIHKLGCKVSLCGVIGNDSYGHVLKQLLTDNGIDNSFIVTDNDRITTVKTRVVSNDNKHLFRIDREVRNTITTSIPEILDIIYMFVPQMDTIVISDYDKGVLAYPLLQEIKNKCKNRPMIVDPKKSLNYYGANIITPNRKEAELFYEQPIVTDKDAEDCCREIKDRYKYETIVLTRGPDGMTILNGKDVIHSRSVAKSVFDVTGAGDTTISVIARYINEKSWNEIAKLASYAAGEVVSQFGTSYVTEADLQDVI